MIQSFRHKGLRRFLELGTGAGIQPHHAGRLRMQSAADDRTVLIGGLNVWPELAPARPSQPAGDVR